MTPFEDRPLDPRPSEPDPDQTGGPIHVAAAALVNGNGEVLLTRRPVDAHQGGLWEFPGGKLEPDESVDRGLSRELHEELGIEVSRHRPLIRVRHDYPDRSVLLDVHRIEDWAGEPHGREGQPLVWVPPERLGDYPMPAADVPIVRALQLPDAYLITPPDIGETAVFLARLSASLRSGIRLVQLRLFDIAQDDMRAFGRDVCSLCHENGTRVLFNGDAAIADAIGADGVHLNSRAARTARERPVGNDHLLAVSCHSPEELHKAQRLGADFALLSPVLPTRSHPDAEPLGWQRFAEWVDGVALPVFALGGMTPEQLTTAWRHGAQGIAGIRGLWRDVATR